MAKIANNWDGSAFNAPLSGNYMDVTSPLDGAVVGKVAVSNTSDVDAAVARAKAAFPGWSSRTAKARAAVLLKLHALLETHAEELADLIVLENSKNKTEALADVAKGNETVEYACSLPQLIQGKKLEVSRGVHCEDVKEPLGVVTAIVPFNFPLMVPMWTVPIALGTGNCVILKPSEKVPLTMARVCELMLEAGIPPGVFQTVNGTREVVESLCDHQDVAAVTFVGSTPIAKAIDTRCRNLHKKVIALGGAKNHLVLLPDADVASAATDIVTSAFGAAGQRCMAASVLLLVGNEAATAENEAVLTSVVQKASSLTPGTGAGQVGPVIDKQSQAKILSYVNNAVEKDGATLLVDGRTWAATDGTAPVGCVRGGAWVGPTVILHQSAQDAACREEIFGPVLSVVRVQSWEEAMAIENSNPFGNAACIYTTVGAHANWFTPKFKAGMVGVNVGIPVPREPFSFGGLYGTLSKFGDLDITGEGAIEFFTNRRKVTSRWPTAQTPALMYSPGGGSNGGANTGGGSSKDTYKDAANFNGNM